MLNSNNKTVHSCERGTLLVEMLAAFAIISITLVMVANTFLVSNRANATAQRQVEVADAIAYALADITREAKVSTGYDFTGGVFSMTHIEGLNGQGPNEGVEFMYDDTNKKMTKSVAGASPLDLTPPSVKITAFNVEVILDGGVTRAILTLTAQHTEATNEPPLYIQTTLTERSN